MDSNEMVIMKKLQEPFPPEDIEWRVGTTNGEKTKGIALAYVTNRAIMNRLDSVFGPFGWKNEFREWKTGSQLCGISVKYEGEWVEKWDGADDSQTEAVKGGLSDAMKRAGYQWGIGRYLYNLENVWAEIEPAGRSYKLKREPQLPDWALPEGYKRVAPASRPTPAPQPSPAATTTPVTPPSTTQAPPSGSPLITDGQNVKLQARAKQAGFTAANKNDLLEAVRMITGRKEIMEMKVLRKSEFDAVLKFLDDQISKQQPIAN